MPSDQPQLIKPIHSEEDHRAALTEIEQLCGAEPGSQAHDRLEVIRILVAEFERRSQPVASSAKRSLRRAAFAAATLVLVCGVALAATFSIYGQNLPDTAMLVTYRPTDVQRLGAHGELVEYRHFVPLSEIPPHVIKAFLAAEDHDYFGHEGYSSSAIVRSTLQSLVNLGTGTPPSSGATITQQVAKNVLLAGQSRSVKRKIREIILARRIERALSKYEILQLHLNSIYFGGYAYGIGAAATQYFGKGLDQVSVAEAAYLAALPKAPNDYRLDVPDNQPRAKERRDWVLARMAQDGLITASAARFAQAEPLSANGDPQKTAPDAG